VLEAWTFLLLLLQILQINEESHRTAKKKSEKN